MKINLNMLPFTINEEIEIPSYYYQDTDIINLDKVKVNGKIDYNILDDVEINLQVSGKMILKDAITNEEVNYPFNIEIKEILAETMGENEKYFEKSKNILDIIEFLWENIVLEVPISFTKEKNAHLKGKGWELNKKEESKDIDPRLEKLSEIFKGGE